MPEDTKVAVNVPPMNIPGYLAKYGSNARFSNTIPPAPDGATNVAWQVDEFGNISASSSGSGGGGPLLQTNGAINPDQNLLNLAAGDNITLTDDGSGTITIAAESGIELETNGTANGSQLLLNFQAGENITLTDNGTGTITIAALAGIAGEPGFVDLQEGADTPPTQLSNSVRLVAPSSVPTSYECTLPAGPPTTGNTVLTGTVGGGAMSWSPGGTSTSAANTWTGSQTFASTTVISGGNVFSAGSGEDLQFAPDSSNTNYTSFTFNGNLGDGTRLGFVAGNAASGDPNLYIDTPATAQIYFRSNDNQMLVIGNTTAPTGTTSTVGWSFTQDGHISYANGIVWTLKI